MLAKLAYTKKVLTTFRNVSLKAKAYLIIRILLLPHGFLKILREILPLEKNVLDVGCGYGLVTLFLSTTGQTGKIRGVDIDTTRIRDLQSLDFPSSVSFEERNLIKKGFSGLEGYETAVLVDILHHLDEPTQVKLIKFLTTHCTEIIIKDIDITPRYKYYWNLFHDRYVMKNEILCFLGSDRIQSEIESHGFIVERRKISSPFPYPHYMLIARKK